MNRTQNNQVKGLEVRRHGWSRSALTLLVSLSLGSATLVRAQSGSGAGSSAGGEVEPQIPSISKDGQVVFQTAPKIPFFWKGEAPPPAPQPRPSDDDEFEPNNTSSEAAEIASGQYELEGWDRDWFAFEMPAEGEITVSIEGPQGDLDLYLFDPANELLAKSVEIGSSEQVSATGGAGTYLIAVTPYQDQGSSYTLTLDIPAAPEPPADDEFEPNNTSSQAGRITSGRYELEGWDRDWFAFELPAEGEITVSIEGPQGDLDLYLFDPANELLAKSVEIGSSERVSATGGTGTYLIAVTPYENQGSSYTLTLDIQVATPEEPEEPEQPEEPGQPEQPEQPEEPEEPEQTGPPTYRALVVGINLYDADYGANSLSGCVNDANDIRGTLLVGDQWQADNITLLTDSEATKSAVRSTLRSLASESGPNDVIVYYQSSHGGQKSGKETFLCTHDASYLDTELGTDLARFGSGQRVIVITDACHSGGLFKEGEWPFAQQVMEACHAERSAQLLERGLEVPKDLGSNVGFMVACNYDQTCIEQRGRGLYTSCLMEACTLSSVDDNDDGRFQFWELYHYAAPKAFSENPRQTAQYYNRTLLENTAARGTEGAGEAPQVPTSDDSYEPNDSPFDAILIRKGRHDLVGLDDDWFDFTMGVGGQITVTIEGPQGDLDLLLFDPTGSIVAESSNGHTSNEQVTITGESGRYSILVWPYRDEAQSASAYKLTLDIPDAGGESGLPPIAAMGCGAGVAQTMVIGLCGLLGIAGSNRRRRAGGFVSDTGASQHDQQWNW